MCQKTSRSATMLGPLKQRWSTQSSCAFHVDGWKKSMMHLTKSMTANRLGNAISVSMMIRKSEPRLMMVWIMPDLKSILSTNMTLFRIWKRPSMMNENISGKISLIRANRISKSVDVSVMKMELKLSSPSLTALRSNAGVTTVFGSVARPCNRRAVGMSKTNVALRS